MLFDMLAGLAIALLSGMGVGSAGLLVVWLTMADAMPQLAAQGLNLYFFIFSSGAALAVHLRRRKIYFGLCALMIPLGVVGALLGSRLSAVVEGQLLRRLFGGMLLVCGCSGLFGVLHRIWQKNNLKKSAKLFTKR